MEAIQNYDIAQSVKQLDKIYGFDKNVKKGRDKDRMPTYEGLRLKVLKLKSDLVWQNYRKKQLKSTDFTIILITAGGGMIYESYNLPKESPTVGMFFIAKDYIEFLSDLKGYINGKLTFIKPEESRWKDMPQVSEDKRFGSYPVGVLSNGKNSIEIFFLHYHSEQEAREKWERRVQRINWNKLLVKFNDQNGCTETEVNKFMKMPYRNKVFFACKHWLNEDENFVIIRQFQNTII